jgi:hypothetical protein
MIEEVRTTSVGTEAEARSVPQFLYSFMRYTAWMRKRLPDLVNRGV